MKLKRILLLTVLTLLLPGCKDKISEISSNSSYYDSTSSSSSSKYNSTSSSESSIFSSSESSIFSSSESTSSTINESSNSSESSSISSTISSDSSISTPEIIAPTVEDAVSTLSFNYTVNYTNPKNEEDYSIFLDNSSQINEIHLYREKTNDGYYFTENDGTYYVYMKSTNIPIYNTNGKLDDEEALKMKSLIDIKSVFSNALWKLETTGNTTIYHTEDKDVIDTCVFLNDGLGENSVKSIKVTLNYKGKLSSFTTYDVNGEIIATSIVKRIGTTYAYKYVPKLDDNMDMALVNKWVIEDENVDTLLGSKNDIFEVFIDGTLATNISNEEGNIYNLDETYSFYAPEGNGAYIFKSENENIISLKFIQGTLFIETYETATEKLSQAIAKSYFELKFFEAVEKAGYIYEPITSNDEMYLSCVKDFEAISAYYIAEVDDNNNAIDLIVATQFVNIPQTIEKYMSGDATLYNGYSLSGYVYANFAPSAAATSESILMMNNITSYLDPEFAAVDESRYLDVPEGTSALDYIIASMISLGYAYNNLANPGIYDEDIQKIIDSNSKDGEVVDVYIFSKDEQYACIVVFDSNNVKWGENGLTNISTIAYGHFLVIGELYGALTTWGNAQPAL